MVKSRVAKLLEANFELIRMVPRGNKTSSGLPTQVRWEIHRVFFTEYPSYGWEVVFEDSDEARVKREFTNLLKSDKIIEWG